MHLDFKSKFVKYLTEGMNIHIAEDEVPLFYKALSDYVNDADNDFMSFHTTLDDHVLISDKIDDYLRVFYNSGKVEFLSASPDSREIGYAKRMGEAFLGVVLFIESMSPSEDSKFIPRVYHDQWQIR